MIFASIFNLNTLCLLSILLALLYYYFTKNFNYWSSRGVPGPKPYPILGTFWQMLTKPFPHVFEDNYKKYGKVYGLFIGGTPVLSIADPELINELMVKDFPVFVDRNKFISGDAITDRNLFNMIGDDWKAMRSIISPTFSTSKMRAMHPIIIDAYHRLERFLLTKADGRQEIELNKVMTNVTMDVIACCAFGLQLDNCHDDNHPNEFVQNATKAIRANWRFWVFQLLQFVSPKLVKWIGLTPFDPTLDNYFRTAIKSMADKRKALQIKPRDYLQLMIEAKNRSVTDIPVIDNTVTNKDETNIEKIFEGTGDTMVETLTTTTTTMTSKSPKIEVTDDEFVSNSFVFLTAGFETTASVLSYLIYKLCLNDKCQQKLYDEVKSFDGNFCYENIAKMPYLEACVAETLRLYTPIAGLGRFAERDYTVGNTGITVTKGMVVTFDVQTLHHSPEYWSDPEHWDPERFMPHNRHKLVPHTYMPFGTGPRNCVGMRFALMEVKTTAAHLVNKFRFGRSPNTPDSLKFKKMDFLLRTEEDIKICLEIR